MIELINKIESLKKSLISRTINQRLAELKNNGESGNERIFKELCFCLLTANYTSEGGIRIQNAIGDGFIHLTETELSIKLKELGYRFPNVRSKYIVQSRQYIKNLKEKILSFENILHARNWLAETILGLGYKEASHFLRNIGYFDCAILDFHIIDILVENSIIQKPKTLTKKKYLEIENKLKLISEKLQLSQGELDFYLWYMETGKILK